ncbi:putative leucine-rich repeat-containing protein DDB_G0290503 isoform X9 [Hippoglossus stenolepis]|uniref:putative leucine-rich repeat-containing protein DDB_G0290503 isoform X9 n=1 Tax=Hippoglossus stenolepis TaxID=195615 RepID=UPI00159C58F2|nr:putative leucine-rich repeat-containing protein DDB_G0290503 isoform X9 [Hippoglossus stenolepis]
MKSAVLFLLLCLSPFVPRGLSEVSVPQEDDLRPGVDGPPELPDLWDELWGLRELVLSLKAEEVERRQALRSMESRLRDREVEAEQQRRSLDGLQETVDHQREELISDLRRRVEETEEQSKALAAQVWTLLSGLNASESSVEHLKKKSAAMASELPFLQTRLRANERTVEQLRRKNAVLAARLCSTESVMEELRRQISGFPASNSSETRLVRLPELNSTSEALHSRPNSSAEGNQLSVTLTTRSSSALEENLSSVTSRLLQLEKNDKARSVEVSAVKSRLTETQAAGQADWVEQLQLRLNSAENHIQQLQTDGAEQTSKLMNLQRNVDSQEDLLDKLNTDMMNRLSLSEKQLQDLKTEKTFQSVQLSSLESRLTGHSYNATDVMNRLRVSEKQLQELKTENTELEVRLSDGEKQLQELKTENTELEVRLSDGEKQLQELKTENTGLEVRLRVGEKQLQELKTENTGELKVAFSAGLTDSGPVGPFDEEMTLIFSKTISNIGRGYNQSTGVFTAPVRGVYFFSFTTADYLKGYMGLYLYRNNQPILFHLDLNDHGGYTSTSSGVALQLEEGDRVRLSLPASYRLYDDSRNFSVFSGFLLFSL